MNVWNRICRVLLIYDHRGTCNFRELLSAKTDIGSHAPGKGSLIMIVFFIISLLASIVGAICGIGGGVIIKPALDFFKMADVSTISFLSGCTVLSMSLYSVGKSVAAKDSVVNFKIGTPMALGAVIGGIFGKQLFSYAKALFENDAFVGAIQAGCLFFITLATLLYTLCKDRVKTHHMQNAFACVVVGIILGMMSSFLGIGGGPINLVVLYYFFSMSTKTAAQNSLYIILFSQLSSFLLTILTGSVPVFQWQWLACMVLGGILGGIFGRIFNRRMNEKAVNILFISLMIVIMGISAVNYISFMGM